MEEEELTCAETTCWCWQNGYCRFGLEERINDGDCEEIAMLYCDIMRETSRQ